MLATTELRLVGGSTPNEGRVEVRRPGGEWSTVCDDNWSLVAASVACRQLGHAGALRAVAGGTYGPGKGIVLMGEVVCNGWCAPRKPASVVRLTLLLLLLPVLGTPTSIGS